MYKVFFNESLLIFNERDENIKANDYDGIRYLNNFYELVDILEEIEKLGLKKTFCIVCNNLEIIKNGFNLVRSAGGLIRDYSNKYLFIRRFNRWDLPKGRIEDGEKSEFAAIREVEEECGIHGQTIKRFLHTGRHIFRSSYYPYPYNWVWKETDWYEMEYFGNETPIPQEEEEITEVRWVVEKDLQEVLLSTYLNIKELFNIYKG